MDGHQTPHYIEALRLARQMIILADEIDGDAVEDSCRLLSATIRDCAYTIRAQAEREREEHRGKELRGGSVKHRETESGPS